MDSHLAWVGPTPTPLGGLTRIHCLCGFRSVPMTGRFAEGYATMHESGVAGLPGSRIGQAPLTDVEVDQIMTAVSEVSDAEAGQ